MNSKKITLILLVFILSIPMTFLTAMVRDRFSPNAASKSPAPPKVSIVGKWGESTTGVTLEFTKDGQLKLMDSTTATYTVDEANHVLTLNYNKEVGGNTAVFSYVLEDATLSLTDQSSGITQSYNRIVDTPPAQ